MANESGVWLAPGDTLWTGAFEGAEWSLVYRGDDGSMWSFDLVRNGESLGRPPVGWYHDRSIVVTNRAERDSRVPHTVRDAWYEPLKASAGMMSHCGDHRPRTSTTGPLPLNPGTPGTAGADLRNLLN